MLALCTCSFSQFYKANKGIQETHITWDVHKAFCNTCQLTTEIREKFYAKELKAKEGLPNVECKCATTKEEVEIGR